MLKKNRQYITDEGRKALEEISRHRGNMIRKTEQEIYEILKNDFRELNLDGISGAERIIYAVERRTGKTTAIIELAAELGIPIVADSYNISVLKNEIKNMRLQDKVKIIILQELENRWDGRRDIPHTVLVDETTDATKVRKALSYLACVREINIIGIQ